MTKHLGDDQITPPKLKAQNLIRSYNVITPFLYSKKFELDSNGLKFDIDGHDITVDIPQGAVVGVEIIEFMIGVAMSGPLRLPESTRPISPILCFQHLQGAECTLQKPVQITLPHCIASQRLAREMYPQISAFKFDYELREAQLPLTQWQKLPVNLGESFGVFQTNSSGIYCIAMIGGSEFTNYCLARVNITPSPPTFKFHFYGLQDLASHKRVSWFICALMH